MLYDLEVEEDCSYVASGIVVSNCRSTSVPVLKSWQELAGVPIKEADNATVDALFREQLRKRGWSEERIATARRNQQVSMSGEVPAELSYADWLKKQSKATQLEVLGRTRFELWNKGIIQNVSQLVSQEGNPLTVRQLKQTFGQAV